MGGSLGALGVGVLLALVAFILIRHNAKHGMKAYRTASILALLSGLCLSGSIVGYLGSITSMSIGGVGVVLAVVVVGGLDFIIMMRGWGHHPMWTPIIGFAVGIAVALAPGAIGAIGHHAQTGVVNTVDKGTHDTVGG